MHNVFNEGKVYVCAEMCETCVFRPGNKMNLQGGRLKGMVETAQENQSAIVCHSTLGIHPKSTGQNAICRGYYDRHSDEIPLVIAKAAGIVKEV